MLIGFEGCQASWALKKGVPTKLGSKGGFPDKDWALKKVFQTGARF